MFELLSEAAEKGAQEIKKLYKKDIEVRAKTSLADVVTEADENSQKAIVKHLLAGMKRKGFNEAEIGFITEEEAGLKPAKHTFIIDPLDGTSGFVFGTDRFSISIAYMVEGEVKVGFIRHPLKDLIYFAEKGKGVAKIENGQKEILKIKEKPFRESFVSFNSNSNPQKSIEMFQIAIDLTPHILRIREQGTLILSMAAVAENKFQAHIAKGGAIWDVAAAKLVIEEAGGVVLDLGGKELEYETDNLKKKYPLICGNQELVKELLRYL